MKKNLFFGIFVLFSCCLVSTSCSNDNDNSSETANNATEVQQLMDIAISGNWIISSFIDSGDDETDHFNGYSFVFNSDGTIIAENGTETIHGSWSVTDDNSSSNNDIDFNIFFASPPDFEELSEDWHITTYTSTKIELIHVSGGNGGTDILEFSQQ